VSSDPAEQPSGSAPGSASTPGEPSEDELRAAYEAELSRITPADMMLQAAVSLLNLGARRLGLTGGGRSQTPGTASGAPEQAAGGAGSEPAAAAAPGEERDLEQVRDAIDGVKALVGILERSMPQELGPLRDALSRLQMAYAREVRTAAGADRSGRTEGPAGEPGARPQGPPDGPAERSDEQSNQTGEQGTGAPGPAESSGRLWVPGR
jgi:hypothetical protein